MRTRRCLTCVLLLVACLDPTAALAEDPVYFADANLKAAVEQALGVSNPTPSDMLRLTGLGVNNPDIASLVGLEYASNLQSAGLQSDRINDLSPLSGLTNLKSLSLRGNEISDLSPLAGLVNLYRIELWGNQITDLSPLSDLTNLQELTLFDSPVSNLSPLSGLMNLYRIELWGNQIGDLSPLASLTNLRRLSLTGDRICDLSPLSGLTNLIWLQLSGKQISDLSALSGLTNLKTLFLYNSLVTSLSPLSGLTNMTGMWLNNNRISDLSGLSGLTNLETVALLGNCISNIPPLTGLPNLDTIYLNNNQIGDLSGLSGLTGLYQLELDNNQISALSPLAGLKNLVYLSLANNQISDLSAIAGLTSLSSLDLGNNQISDFSPLAGLTNLWSLDLGNNPISDLTPLDALTKLGTLDLRGNRLVDIAVLSSLTAPVNLYLQDNWVSDLSPLAHLTRIQDLFLDNNRISDISPLVGLDVYNTLILDGNPLNREAYCHDLEAFRLSSPRIRYLGFPCNANPPGGVSATGGMYEDKVTITWEALCPGPAPHWKDTFSYMVYRSTSREGIKEALSGWLSSTSYDDATALPGVHYWYWVKSDKSGETFSDPDEGWRALPTGPSLVISSTGHGSVTTPGEGAFSYAYGTSVPVVATPIAPYAFINWTGTAMDAGKVADPAAASTTVIVDGPYTLQANFTTTAPGTMRALTTASTVGGRVWEPGEGTFEYDDGTEVSVVAMPDDGYQFVRWTGTAVDAGKVADPESASIALMMDADYTLTANFEPAGGPLEYKLVVSAGAGGYVSEPGEGTFTYEVITTVPITAHAYTGYRFSGWTGTAVNAGKVASTTSENTTVMVDGDYGLQANFIRSGQFSVKVLAPNGGESLLAGSTFPIRWQTQGEIASLSIDLTPDGGSTWMHVGSPSASAGSYDWPVPKIDSDRCLIRLCVLDNAAISDVSDAFFSVHKPIGHIWYADAAAAPGGDGTSWETAFVHLQDGLARAADGDSVWVTEGLYWPDLGTGQTVGDRVATFRLKKGVAVCGGFPTGGGVWQQRNPFLHQSILSGDIGTPNVNADNSYHVVTGSGTDKTAVLDGCTITGGFANGTEPQDRGAGLYNLRGSPQIRNCIFVGNVATAGNGGGACNIESEATFTNCVFNSNTAGNCGGGVYNEQGNVTITNCTFMANQGLWRGGGVFNASGATAVINCILWANGRMGGVSYDELAQVAGDVKPTVDRCCVQGWTGSLGGQGNFGRDPLFLDAAGADNVAGTPDDDLRLQAGSPCIDKGDNAAVPGEVCTDQQGNPRIVKNAVDVGAYEFGEMSAPSETGAP